MKDVVRFWLAYHCWYVDICNGVHGEILCIEHIVESTVAVSDEETEFLMYDAMLMTSLIANFGQNKRWYQGENLQNSNISSTPAHLVLKTSCPLIQSREASQKKKRETQHPESKLREIVVEKPL